GLAFLAITAFGMSPADPTAFLAAIGLLGLGLLPLLVILVDETDNAFADVYSIAVSVQNLAPRRRQAGTILAATIIGTGVAWYLLATGQGIGGAYEYFLLLIGGLFVPLLGVVIADSFVVRRRPRHDDLRKRRDSPVAPGVRRQGIIREDDRRFAVQRVDCNLEQIEQVPSASRAAGAVRANHADMVRMGGHRDLQEVRTVVRRLGHVRVPHRGGVVFVQRGRAIVHDVDLAAERRNPWEHGRRRET